MNSSKNPILWMLQPIELAHFCLFQQDFWANKKFLTKIDAGRRWSIKRRIFSITIIFKFDDFSITLWPLKSVFGQISTVAEFDLLAKVILYIL